MTEDDDLLAAEYALGLVDETARAASDPEFAGAVETWRIRFDPLLGPERAPPPELWSRVIARLPANDTGQADPARGWRFATFAASAAAAALLGVIVLRPDAAAPGPAPTPQVAVAPEVRIMVASLTPKDGAGAVTVSYDERDGRLVVNPVDMDADGKTPELWVIPADGTPRSLGVIQEKAAGTRIVPQNLRALVAGATFAVSLEPDGGSPTGSPTGPVVMTGTMSIV